MKILIAYDGSECGSIALEDLKRAGLPAEAEVLVMSMADVFLPIIAADDNSEPPPVPDVVQRAREHAQQQLAEARDLAKRASDQIESMFRGWRVRREALADSPARSLSFWRQVNSWQHFAKSSLRGTLFGADCSCTSRE
jgi:hypothetical protein